MKHIYSFALLIVLLFSSQASSAQDIKPCSPHISDIGSLLAQAQSNFDKGDAQAGLDTLTRVQNQLNLEISNCLNSAPDTAGDKRTNPVLLGQWKSLKTDLGGQASVQIADFVDNADPQTTIGQDPEAGNKIIAFRVKLRCESSPDVYCSLDDYTTITIVGGSGIQYTSIWQNEQQDRGAPDQVYGTGELSHLYAFEVNADDSNFEIKLSLAFPNSFWFATQ